MFQEVKNGKLGDIYLNENGIVKKGSHAIPVIRLIREPGFMDLYPIEKPDYDLENEDLSAPYFDSANNRVTYDVYDATLLNSMKWKNRERTGDEIKRKTRVTILREDAIKTGIWKDKAVDLMIQQSPHYIVNTSGESDKNGTLIEVYLIAIDPEDQTDIENYVAANAAEGTKLDIYEEPS